MKSGKLNFPEPSGPLQACNWTALPLPLLLLLPLPLPLPLPLHLPTDLCCCKTRFLTLKK
jgi:hypothetical protein